MLAGVVLHQRSFKDRRGAHLSELSEQSSHELREQRSPSGQRPGGQRSDRKWELCLEAWPVRCCLISFSIFPSAEAAATTTMKSWVSIREDVDCHVLSRNRVKEGTSFSGVIRGYLGCCRWSHSTMLDVTVGIAGGNALPWQPLPSMPNKANKILAIKDA